MQIRKKRILDNSPVAATEVNHNVMSHLLGGVQQRLKRCNVKIANIDPVAGVEMLNGIDAHPLAEQELVVPFAAMEAVTSGAPEQQVPSLTAEQVVIAFAANEGVIALAAEQPIIALPAIDQIVATASVDLIIAVAGENGVVSAQTEDDIVAVRSKHVVVADRPENLLTNWISVVMFWHKKLPVGRLIATGPVNQKSVTATRR
jgi:hypothetical protein